MSKCMFCGNPGLTVCYTCHRTTGVREMPPPRRRPSPCERCNHSKLIRVIPRELSVTASRANVSYDANRPGYGPMYATYPALLAIPFSSNEVVVEPPEAHQGYGLFETYICKQCGFTEWFCHDPEHIPIGPQYMTEEIDSDGDTPYR